MIEKLNGRYTNSRELFYKTLFTDLKYLLLLPSYSISNVGTIDWNDLIKLDCKIDRISRSVPPPSIEDHVKEPITT